MVMMTVSGVFQLVGGGRDELPLLLPGPLHRAHRPLESKTLTHRKARKLRPPIRRQVLRSPSSVARSLEMSANTRKRLMGASER